MSLNVNLTNFNTFYNSQEIEEMYKRVSKSHRVLFEKNGKGNEFLGFINLPETIKPVLADISKTASEIRGKCEVLVVVGVGGAYLGAKSAIEFMKSPNYNIIDRNGAPQIFFVGNNMSADHLDEIIKIIGDRDFCVNMISKSGSTAEPVIAFHFLKNILKKRHKDNWASYIYVTADEKNGDLRKFSDQNNCVSYIIDSDLGGRFSVLSAVGLLPIACAGIDIEKIIKGACLMRKKLMVLSKSNPAVQYAVARNLAYDSGKTIEILGCYEPRFKCISEWWKQLFGESEGKDLKGIFPATVDLTADLHSVGQYIQDGIRNIFETIIHINKGQVELVVENSDSDFSRLEIFEGLKLSDINKTIMEGTTKAHVDGNVPNILINIDDNCEESYGQLTYFFEISCGLSAYTLGVNPFDQPGVEAYKKEMIKLILEKKS